MTELQEVDARVAVGAAAGIGVSPSGGIWITPPRVAAPRSWGVAASAAGASSSATSRAAADRAEADGRAWARRKRRSISWAAEGGSGALAPDLSGLAAGLCRRLPPASLWLRPAAGRGAAASLAAGTVGIGAADRSRDGPQRSGVQRQCRRSPSWRNAPGPGGNRGRKRGGQEVRSVLSNPVATARTRDSAERNPPWDWMHGCRRDHGSELNRVFSTLLGGLREARGHRRSPVPASRERHCAPPAPPGSDRRGAWPVLRVPESPPDRRSRR